MSEKYSPQKGDRVRVVLEGEIKTVDLGEGVAARFEGDDYWTTVNERAPFVVSIEKLEPPVEVFKPGDVVREIERPSVVRTIARAGWINHESGSFYTGSIDCFTSEDYERVTLS